MRVRTLVVGGGVMGASVAWHVARRSDPLTEPVLLLERREFGAGSSGRSGAILRQFYSDRELIGMARDSLRVYSKFELATGRAIGFTRCGVLTIAAPHRLEAFELLQRNLATMRECGVEAERVDARAMRELVPGIEVGDDALGVWEPTSGFVDPVRTVEAFAALARHHGATTRVGVEVTGFVPSGKRIVAVQTNDGVIEVEQVVVAAGPWTKRLLALAGVEVPLRAVRPEQHFVEMLPARRGGYASSSNIAEDDCDARFARPTEPTPAHPVLLDLENGFYTRCEPRFGRTRVGALDYARDLALDDPDVLDETVSAQFSTWSRDVLERRLPAYRESPDRGAQAAWYTLTPDAQALIGPCAGFENLHVVSGFSGHGFKLAPSIGEGVAQMLAGEPIGAFDARFFAPHRFEASALDRWSGAFGL